jgi:hypothetical protein
MPCTVGDVVFQCAMVALGTELKTEDFRFQARDVSRRLDHWVFRIEAAFFNRMAVQRCDTFLRSQARQLIELLGVIL